MDNARRMQRYREDPVYRAKIQESRRLRYQNDEAYRATVLEKTNGRRIRAKTDPVLKAKLTAERRAWANSLPVAKKLWNSAKQRAKTMGLEFTLSVEGIAVPEFCPVLGIKMRPGVGFATPESPSLDRVDNSRGYTPDNVRVISRRANVLKNDGTIEEHEAVVRYMREHARRDAAPGFGGDL